MTGPAPIDVAVQRRRLVVMAAINVACLFTALAGAVGFISFHLAWMGAVFAGAILAGFAAQVWLVLGMKRRP
ncbi:hypothetical protein [Phenylobacterium montanum]|uniref:Uncharacterized protein n=1 Tax=Phenylobacterium montanum TaxID=2823693 RepID=A0A975FZS3_9CAUL|nr:hypothetical protein [Caulobacter sp. S6]QUD88498.1 hypothetical protein KCG34_00980 [Caulobacter sp. S6]